MKYSYEAIFYALVWDVVILPSIILIDKIVLFYSFCLSRMLN